MGFGNLSQAPFSDWETQMSPSEFRNFRNPRICGKLKCHHLQEFQESMWISAIFNQFQAGNRWPMATLVALALCCGIGFPPHLPWSWPRFRLVAVYWCILWISQWYPHIASRISIYLRLCLYLCLYRYIHIMQRKRERESPIRFPTSMHIRLRRWCWMMLDDAE